MGVTDSQRKKKKTLPYYVYFNPRVKKEVSKEKKGKTGKRTLSNVFLSEGNPQEKEEKNRSCLEVEC